MAKIKFDKLGKVKIPTLILQNKNFENIGNIVNASDLTYKENMNSANELSFTVYKKDNPYWDKIKDLKVLYVPEWDERFEISVSKKETDSIAKTITATSLCEAELSQIVLRDIEINTEDDIANDVYDENFPTVFFRNPDSFQDINWSAEKYNGKYADYTDAQKKSLLRQSSLLHRLLEKAPHYSIGHVEGTLLNLQRDFSISETSIYDELTGEIAEEFNCIFIFDSMARTINVYDLYNTCSDCGYRGDFADVCPECSSTNISGQYGKDTTIFVSSDNLAQDLTIEGDKDSLKNCMYISGGDDAINAAIASCNPSGSRYIYYWNDDILDDMPTELVEKLKSYNELLDSYDTYEYTLSTDLVTKYNTIVSNVNTLFEYDDDDSYTPLPENGKLIGYDSTTIALYESIDLYNFLKTSMMPNIDISGVGIDDAMNSIVNGFASGFTYIDDNGKTQISFKNQIAIQNRTTAVKSTIERVISNTAKLYYGSAYYDLSLNTESYVQAVEENGNLKSGTGIWKGTFTLTSLIDTDENTGEYISRTSNVVTLTISSDLDLFLEQSIMRAMSDKESLEKNIITSLSLSDSDFASRIKLYSLDELNNLNDAFESCLSVIISADIDDDTLKNKYYNFYNGRISLITSELVQRNSQLETVKKLYYFDSETSTYSGELYNIRLSTKKSLDLQSYIGTELWNVFCSYIREDTYSNDNYISDGLSNKELIENTQKLIDVAKKELYKAGNLQYTISSTLNNLLAIPEFEPLKSSFEVGNWIRVRVDDEIHRLRLLSYEINFDDLQNISVEFSTVEKRYDGISDIQSVLSSVSSIATSYSSVVNQVEKTTEATKQVSDSLLDGINAETRKLINSDNEDIVINKNGILCRAYDEQTNTYSDRQMKWLKNGMYFTDDNWETLKAGIGTYYYVDPETKETKTAYGIFGDTIVGNIILGEQLGIYNEDASLKFNNDGLVVSNGTNTVTINPNEASKLMKISNSKDDVFYVDETGDVNLNGNIFAQTFTVEDKISIYNSYTNKTNEFLQIVKYQNDDSYSVEIGIRDKSYVHFINDIGCAGSITSENIKCSYLDCENLTCEKTIKGNAFSASQLEENRLITIGNDSKYFDGTSDISFSLSEIGAISRNDFDKLLKRVTALENEVKELEEKVDGNTVPAEAKE